MNMIFSQEEVSKYPLAKYAYGTGDREKALKWCKILIDSETDYMMRVGERFYTVLLEQDNEYLRETERRIDL